MPLQRCLEPYAHWLFHDPLSGDSLRIVPERGGLVSSWRCGGRELLYLDAERFADPALSVRGGIPVLFPICGNLPDDRLTLPQGSFHLPQHGFARDRPWQLQELPAGDGIVLVLEDSAETRTQFPFAFRLELELRLEALSTGLAGPRTAPTAPRASLRRVHGGLTAPAGRRRIRCLLDSGGVAGRTAS